MLKQYESKINESFNVLSIARGGTAANLQNYYVESTIRNTYRTIYSECREGLCGLVLLNLNKKKLIIKKNQL